MKKNKLPFKSKLIFVYNAQSDPLSAAINIAHKILSPSTYPCHLCRLTHHALSEKKEWLNFRKQSGIEMVFYHRNDFEEKFGRSYLYPVIIEEKEAGLFLLLDRESLEKTERTTQLIEAIKRLVDH